VSSLSIISLLHVSALLGHCQGESINYRGKCIKIHTAQMCKQTTHVCGNTKIWNVSKIRKLIIGQFNIFVFLYLYVRKSFVNTCSVVSLRNSFCN
jgi:uncharacterized DUF497 family protein